MPVSAAKRVGPTAGPDLGLRPLSARSVVLSLLLGAHPAQLPVRDLVRTAELLGIAEPTLRVALTRMVAAGDLLRTDAAYRLSDRLLDRQRRQDDAVRPPTREWHGQWELVVITATGRTPTERLELRTDLARLRLAELREGTWLRPANLRRDWPQRLDAYVHRFTGRPDADPRDLVRTLWDLPAWAGTARALLAHLDATDDPAERMTAAAAIVRQLLADPALPATLLPPDWPGGTLRVAYTAYQRDLIELARAGPAAG